MKLKKITFKEALIILSEGGKIYLDPEEYKDHPPIYLDDKKGIMNADYMDVVDLPHFGWYAEG